MTAKKKTAKPKVSKKKSDARAKAEPNDPLPKEATDAATQEAKEREPLDTATDVSAEHEAHVQEQGIDGDAAAKRRVEEMEAADAAAKNLKTRENTITKKNLKDYGFEKTKDGVNADTTWGAYYVDYTPDKEPEVVFARRIDASFKVGKTEVNDGYLVVDAGGSPKAVSKTAFEEPGRHTPTI